jgi:glycosyltransferase involved in cell wall biosynthesis
MSPAPRVLILNERDLEHPNAGGAEVHVGEIFERLAARGFDITLASTTFPGSADDSERGGMRIRRFGRIRYYYLRAGWHCARETRRGRYDVVVDCMNKLPFQSPLYSAAPVLAIAHHLFGKSAFLQVSWPVAMTVYAMESMIPRIYRNVPFVAISQSTRTDLIERGIAPDHIEVHHCGIRRPSLPPAVGSVRGARIAYVGRLARYKQIDVLLRATAKLVERFPGLQLDIIGKGADSEYLADIARDEGIGDRTHFHGFVDDEERDRLIATARVCVCPSTKEGWGLTVIESNALGTPVVATDAPGLRDSVEDDRTGFLVPDRDVDAFADRIGRLLADDALWRRMSDAALEWSRLFDWDAAAEQMGRSLEAARSTS